MRTAIVARALRDEVSHHRVDAAGGEGERQEREERHRVFETARLGNRWRRRSAEEVDARQGLLVVDGPHFAADGVDERQGIAARLDDDGERAVVSCAAGK